MSKSLIRLSASISAVALFAFLASCSSKQAAEPAATAPAPAAAPAAGVITKDSSVIDVMKDTLAPTSEALWNAVGTESTATGSKDLAPSTDAEWAALRQKAQTLIDAAKALTEEGRVVGHPGQKLKDPPGPGDFSPEQAQAEISKSRPAFVAFATALQAVGGDFITAIDKKNVDAFMEVGGKLDEVCEACHTKYWYPNAPKPPGL